MKKFKTTLIALAISALPVLALASTYQYVDTGGNLRSVEANSPTQALATAPNLHIHSGVMLVSGNATVVQLPNTGTVVVGTGNGSFYRYVDTNGNLRGVWATSAAAALVTAPNIGMHSGVMLVAN